MKNVISILVLFIVAISLVGCIKDEPTPDVFQIQVSDASKLNLIIDIYETTYLSVKLTEFFTATSTDGLTYEIDSPDETGLTTSSIQNDSTVAIFSQSKIGDFNLNVSVIKDSKEVLAFVIKVAVLDGSPNPTIIKEIEDQFIDAPIFSNGTTSVEYSLDLANYFDASDYITFSMESDDEDTKMTINGKIATFSFNTFGTKSITINALKNDNIIVSSNFNAILEANVPNQLFNGDFENGWTGWDCDEWGKLVYQLYDSPFDIWGNNVNGNGFYLYGYYNESGTAEFESSLFKVGGTGVITFKMAGNSTEELSLKLMKYNIDAEDEEVAIFNNWYFGKYGESGFIFRDYFYQIDLEKYEGTEMYFVVNDNQTSDFGFICLDDIVTYHSTPINEDNFYRANFMVDPTGAFELDYSDTSKDAFPTDLSTVDYQLVNGDFEAGYTGWYMTTEDKNNYAIYDSKVDIWSNKVNATKHYLYGYKNESAVCEFHSSLFRVGGNGIITFKIAGNSTADLQFKLMKFNPDGEDTLVETFNNWYFPISEESGFIFRDYYYQIDLYKYNDSYMYFVVKDARLSDFGFICLDDIVTYYEITPELLNYYKAGYCTDPDASN